MYLITIINEIGEWTNIYKLKQHKRINFGFFRLNQM